MTTPSRILLLLALVATCPPSAPGQLSSSAQPDAKYRLTRQGVAGLAEPQWVFVIVTPEGHPWVGTDAKLRWMIEQAVPANATLEWNSGCKRIGGEPLESPHEVEALKAFCAQRNVRFVHLLAG